MTTDITKYKNGLIHFIGCGGAGMFPLALILIERGYTVSGSDMKASRNTEILSERGATISIGHTADNLQQCHNALVVYSSAVSEENPELSKARNNSLTCLRRGEMLGCLSHLYKRTVAVSGSHGKTTVTGMLAHILETCKIPAGYMIGGKLQGKEIPAHAGNGDIFVTEVDESDGTHADMHCAIGIVTNVECDHSWSVGGEERLYQNFQTFAGQSEKLVYVQSDKSDSLFEEHRNKEALIGTRIAERCNFRNVEPARLAEWGEYQRINAALAINAAVKLGLSREEAGAAMSSFNGVDRRMTVHSQTDSTVIIEDYAHHPTEVRVALEALRERFPDHKITIVFQPHRYARLAKYLDDFAKELRKADQIVVTPVFAAWVEKGDINSSDLALLIGEHASNMNCDWEKMATSISNPDGMKERSYFEEKRVIAVFGAGTVNQIIPHLQHNLQGGVSSE